MKFNFYVLYILFAVFTFVFSEKAHAQMPAVQWGTYYGDNVGDFGNSVATDKDGNVYIAGHTRSLSNIATAGAQWPNPTINPDASIFCGFLVKFNSSGIRQWATYIPEEVNDIACDENGNIYLTGKSNNSSLINIATTGSHQTSNGGEEDAFLMKLSPSGGLLWATYYGGSKNDFGNSIAVDYNGDIYIAGTTISDMGIATGGTHKSVKTDALGKLFFLAKFNSSGVRQWGTYYGDETTSEDFNDNNEAYSINVATDINRNVYICGTTESMLGIATPGSHRSSKINGSGPNRDVFVAKLNSSGDRIWGTYYGGEEDDWAGHIVCDLAGDIYFSGITQSLSGIATPGTQQPGFLPGTPTLPFNMMLVKFAPNFIGSNASRSWGTYYGRKSGITGFSTSRGMSGGLAVDPSGFIYLAGANGANGGAGNFGDYDATLSKFEPTSGRSKADTSVGTGNIFDFGAAVAIDPAGNVFLVGSTRSVTDIATPDGFQQQLNNNVAITGVTDAFLIKFKNADTTVYFKDLHLQPTGFCLGDTFRIPYGVTHPFKPGNVFTVQLYNTTGFVDIGSHPSSDSGSIFCTIPDPFPLSNPLKIRIIASDPDDTTVVNALSDTVSAMPEFDLIGDTVICQGTRANFTIIPTSGTGLRFLWAGPMGFTDNIAMTGVDNPAPDNTGFYVATVSAGGCKARDSIFLRVKPRPEEPLIAVDSTVCQGDTLFLRAFSSMPTAGYHWNGPNNLSQGSAIPETYVLNMPIEGTGLYYVAAGIDDCYSDTVSAYVRVKPVPRTTFISTNNICEGDTLRIWPVTNATDSIFEWWGPNGFHSFDTNVVLANIPYESRGNYVLAAGIDGCVGFAGVDVEIKPKPKFMATSNSPVYEGDKLRLDVADERFSGATYKWLGPDSFRRENERNPERDSVDPDRHTGNYHVTATLNGCEYVGITNVIIYRLNYDELFLYPIPNNGNFKVKGTMRVNMPINVEIVNTANQLVGKDMIYPQRRRFYEEYWLEDNLANGQYYFRAKINGKWKVVPFTIVK
ncbi:MAG: hypothetical protein EOP56_12705 [Sphingobacteriales bacterium]|nr:MAG: hypothetical protein EOP56_12705 [Sphingobacteriales bacterium]